MRTPQKVAVCKPRREASEEIYSAGTSTLALRP